MMEIFRLAELNLTLDAGMRQVRRDGFPIVDFGGRDQTWRLIWALAKRYPAYFDTMDLCYEIANGGYVVEVDTMYRKIFDLKALIRPIGVTAASARKVGYRLVDAATSRGGSVMVPFFSADGKLDSVHGAEAKQAAVNLSAPFAVAVDLPHQLCAVARVLEKGKPQNKAGTQN